MSQKKEISFSEEFVKWFSEIHKENLQTAGGKGANLGEMFNNNFPVPPGFVITSGAFKFFIKNIIDKIKNIILEIDFNDTSLLESKAKEIREIIINQEMPNNIKEEILEAYQILGAEKIDEQRISEDALNILKNSKEPVFVSVRSSATTEDLSDASFAGQQESFLNVKGNFELIENVKRCFASLYTARALYYRNKKGFSEDESLLAVVVQKMVNSEKSGVIFSKDPISLANSVVIEAVFGLGEGIVSGKINPDNYVVDATDSEDLKIREIKVNNKKIALVRSGGGENQIVKLSHEKSKEQVLTRGEILELANYAVKLEKHYKKPQDIEFGVEDNRIYILQSRPITTLNFERKKVNLSGKIILEGLGASPGIGVGNVKIIKTMEDLSKIKKGDVLVTEMTNPDMVVSMQKCVAIVTNEGGMTAHASIVSREMGIPAVVGTGEATLVLKDGMLITVDGSNGKIYEGKTAETHFAEVKPVVRTRTKLKLILDLPEFAERAAESEIEYVGLLRLEGIIASSGKHPLIYEKEGTLETYTNLLKKGIEKISEPFAGIWIRSSDLRTDEYNSLQGAPEKEINPMLGLHGIRFSLEHLKIFEAELKAIKHVAEANPEKEFGVMFPQIISIMEVKKAKEIFNKFKQSNMKIGVMIETPAAVQIIDDICKEVDFISLGTNDLTQYTLAVDRGEETLQGLYDETHPAVFHQIKRVLRACRENNVESSICGQAGSNKEMVEFLMKVGINSISVNADAAYEISRFVSEIEEKTAVLPEKKYPLFSNQEKNKKINDVIQQPKKIKNPRKIICAECGSETILPFKPRGNRLFYCNKCFKKKKNEDEGDVIHAFDSKERLKNKSEKINQEIDEEKLEKMQENMDVEERIKTEVLDPDKGVSSGPFDSEDIGIYNPNEEQDEPKKMNYNFDDDENIYSDVF